GEADALDEAREQAPGATHERLPREVLLLPPALAHEEHVGVRVTHAEDHLRARLGQRALRARERFAFEVGPRGERRWFQQRHGETRLVGGRRRASGQTPDPGLVRWYATASRTASAVTSVTMTRTRSRWAST